MINILHVTKRNESTLRSTFVVSWVLLPYNMHKRKSYITLSFNITLSLPGSKWFKVLIIILFYANLKTLLVLFLFVFWKKSEISSYFFY